MKFKVGDRVRIKKYKGCGVEKDELSYCEITKINGTCYYFTSYDKDGVRLEDCYNCHNDESFELIQIKNNKSIMQTIKQFIKDARRNEPEKSFIKAGVLDETEEFTEDGREMFLEFLFQENKKKFNETIVQPYLAEQEKKSKE